MYYIQNVHSLRGLSRDGMGTCLRYDPSDPQASPLPFLKPHPHPLVRSSSFRSGTRGITKEEGRLRGAEGRDRGKKTRGGGKEEAVEPSGEKERRNTAAEFGDYSTSRRMVGSAGSDTVRRTRPRYDFTFYFYNKCSRT